MIRASSTCSQDNYLRSSMTTIGTPTRLYTNTPKIEEGEGSHPSGGHRGKLEFDTKAYVIRGIESPQGNMLAKSSEDLKASQLSTGGRVAKQERTIHEMHLQDLQHKHTVSKQQSQLRAAQSKISSLQNQVEQQQCTIDQLTTKNLNLTLQHESDRETIARLEAMLATLQKSGMEATMAENNIPLVDDQTPNRSFTCNTESDVWNESLSCVYFHESTKSFDEWSYSSNNSLSSLNNLELDEVRASGELGERSPVQAVDNSDSVQVRQYVQDILQASEDPDAIKPWSPTSCMEPFEDDDTTDFVLGLKFLDEGTNEGLPDRSARLSQAT